MTIPEIKKAATKQWPCVQMFSLWLVGAVLIGIIIAVLWLGNQICGIKKEAVILKVIQTIDESHIDKLAQSFKLLDYQVDMLSGIERKEK